jgi:hypothetical protein
MAKSKSGQDTWNDGCVGDYEALEQLLEDIFEVFPRGCQRDVWLALLAQLAADVMWLDIARHRTLH